MKIKRTLAAALLVLASPLAASAAVDSDGVNYCGTPYPFWWFPNGPRGPVSVVDVKTDLIDDHYLVTLRLQNTTKDSFQGGVPFVLTHAITKAEAFGDPGSLKIPPDPYAVMDTETLYSDKLPPLEPGQFTEIRVEAKGYASGVNHLLTPSIYGWEDGDPICPDPWPRWPIHLPPPPPPYPWWEKPYELADVGIQQIEPQVDGYESFDVNLAIRNVGKEPIKAGTLVTLGHSHGSAVGLWPDDHPIDPHDPSNPYAITYRERLASFVLDRDVQPGDAFKLHGIANAPKGVQALDFLSVEVGPASASAAAVDVDGAGYCGTPYPFWWFPNGPHGPLSVVDVKATPVGEDYQLTVQLRNDSAEPFAGGVPFVLTHAIAKADGFPDPGALKAPPDPYDFAEPEVLYSDKLPELRPGETTSITVMAKGYGSGINHMLTTSIYGEPYDDICPPGWPFHFHPPHPWPHKAFDMADPVIKQIEPTLPGYDSYYLSLTFTNTSDVTYRAGTPVSLGHGTGFSALGRWPDDQPHDPKDPGNPYALFFRERLVSSVLQKDLQPGDSFTLEGVANIPSGSDGIHFVTANIGQAAAQ